MARAWITTALFAAAPLFGAANAAFAPDTPPVTSRITVGTPDPNDRATLSGLAGAVPANSWVIAVNQNTVDYEIAQASNDGSFTLSLLAPPGSSLQIKADPLQKFLPRFPSPDLFLPAYAGLPGAVLRVPSDPATGRFAGVTRAGTPASYVLVDGSIGKLSYRPGDTMTISAKLTFVTNALQTSEVRGNLSIGLARVTSPEGRETAMENEFASTLMTPTGLPVERRMRCASVQIGRDVPLRFTAMSGGRGSMNIEWSGPLPDDLLPGYYHPFLRFFFQNPPAAPASPKLLGGNGGTPNYWMGVNAPMIRVGDPAPPRLSALLFADVWNQGMRGVSAIEDHRRFAMVPHVATQSEAVSLPRYRYRVEPHLPLMGVATNGAPLLEPRFHLKLPSGSLTAQITRPDGSTVILGPAPFAQWRSIGPVKDNGEPLAGGKHPDDVYQLSTMDERFDVEFQQHGRYRIVLDGSVDDLYGTTWRIAGTYDVIIAEPLVLDTGMLPGTPLQTGDRLSLTVTTIPPVPAQVEVRVRHAEESNPSRMRDIIVRGQANRFGFFRPSEEALPLDASGEYRLDVTATFVDANGVWWAGSRTWGSVVAPRDDAILVHGRRGYMWQETPRLQWFQKSQISAQRADSHATFPFQSGDVMWQNDAAMLVAVTMQDTQMEAILGQRCHDPDELPGEKVPASIRLDGKDLHLDPARTDLWNYAYGSVQRPLIRVREVISDGGVGHGFAYWTFREAYGAQLGAANGDQPDDIKFLFGGVVARGPLLARPRYGIYGSLFVLLRDSDRGNTRVFPPFQGNGGGPSGGPITTIAGKPIDLFFHPTALRPGTVVERGAQASFAGYVAPPLPARVEFTVLSPSGRKRSTISQANLIGFVNDPATAFTVDETGVWRAKIRVWFEGTTSAGQVAPPYPSGDVIGSREGEFYFYATERSEAPLHATVNVRRADAQIDVQAPAGMTGLQLHTTTMIPGVILEETTSSSLQYVYDAGRLSETYPNVDRLGPDALFDTVTITLLLSGTDSAGARRHLARQVVLQGKSLQLTDQQPIPPRPRRRNVLR